MNTNKVKNIIIILLVLLNAALFALLIVEHNKYRLSNSHVAAIRELFAENDIEIIANIPRSFHPRRTLYASPFPRDIDIFISAFFQNGAYTTHEMWDGVFFSNENNDIRVTITGLNYQNFILEYINEAGFSTPEFALHGFNNTEAVRQLTYEFVRQITPAGLSFVHTYTNVDIEEELAVVWFRGYHRGYVMRDNVIQITITNDGIIWAEFGLAYIPHNFSNVRREIISADEALFGVLQHLVPQFAESHVVIYDISRAYFTPDLLGAQAENEQISLTPSYRIIAKINGSKQTYWVNAFTNERFDPF